jgi:hypothetical protein
VTQSHKFKVCCDLFRNSLSVGKQLYRGSNLDFPHVVWNQAKTQAQMGG